MEGLNPLVKSRDHQMGWKRKTMYSVYRKTQFRYKDKDSLWFYNICTPAGNGRALRQMSSTREDCHCQAERAKSKQGPQKPREAGYWQVNRELSPLVKGNKFSKKKKKSMGLELDYSPVSRWNTAHLAHWFRSMNIWAELFTHRTMNQEIAVALSLVNVWQLLTKQEENNPNRKLHTRQKLIKRNLKAQQAG